MCVVSGLQLGGFSGEKKFWKEKVRGFCFESGKIDILKKTHFKSLIT